MMIAVLDACVLCSPIKRTLLASLAEAGLFQIRWSEEIMQETEKAISIIAGKRFEGNANALASQARMILEQAFPEAMVTGHQRFDVCIGNLPDEGDRHVISAAIKAKADMIVTENLRDFPRRRLSPLDLDAMASDPFLLSTTVTSPHAALAAIERARCRFQRADKTPAALLADIKNAGLTQFAGWYQQQIPTLTKTTNNG